MSRFVQPTTRRLTLSDGEWVVVKERLSIGELRALYVQKYRTTESGSVEVRFENVGIVDVAAYLVEWSFPEMPIRGASLDVITTAVRNLEPDAFFEIEAALDAHVAAVEAERAAQKKTRPGATGFSPTSPSLVAVGGATSG